MAKAKSYYISQDDFSGGIQERNKSFDSFSERSIAAAKGFVFDDEQTLRSQWEAQKVGVRADLVAVHPFHGSPAQGSPTNFTNNYLVGITTGGALVYALAPKDDASDTDLAGLTWQTVQGFNYVTDATVSLATGAGNLKFLLDNDRIEITTLGLVNCLTLGNSDGLTAANVADSLTMVKVYESSTGVLRGAVFTQKFPTDTASPNNTVEPATKQGPPANVGVILGSRLFLGDSLYNRDSSQPLSATNFAKYRNSVWFSEALTSTFFGLANLDVGSKAAQIRALHNIDNRIIAITTAGVEGDGLIMVYGEFTAPAEAAAANEITGNINQRILRGGVGAPPKVRTTHTNYSTEWEAVGSVIFIDAKGGVWSTEGTTVNRIDEFGPVAPKLASEIDHCEAIGNYLLVSRAGRLLVANLLSATDADGTSQACAWTELVTPGTGQVMSMVKLESSVYFIQDGSLHRFNLASPERGRVNGELVDLVFATRTMGDGGAHNRKAWLRFGFGLTGTGTVQSVRFTRDPWVAGSSSGVVKTPEEPVVSGIRKYWLNMGIGSSVQSSSELVVRGDLVVDDVEWFVNGVEPKR